MHPDAARWNARYSKEREYYLQREPYELVLSHADLLPAKGIVLDAAAGVSPLAIFLARRNLHVIALDVSLQALRAAQARMRAQNLHLDCAILDLTDPWLPSDFFDVILNFYFLSQPFLDLARAALKPGGLLFCEILLWDERSGTTRQHYLQAGELEEKFSDWKIIYKGERQRHGRQSEAGSRRAVQLIAEKPTERV